MKKRRMTAMLLTLSILLCMTAILPEAAASTDTVTVVVNGQRIRFPDAPAYIDTNGRTQIPIRYVGEALGTAIEWDQVSSRATFSMELETGTRYVEFYIGSDVFYIKDTPGMNPQRRTMDTAAIVESGRTYVPVRFLAEAFGATVSWDASSRTVRIVSTSVQPSTPPAQTERPDLGAFEYDIDGLLLARHANVFYQEWFESLRITYEGERVFLSYIIPEGLPANTEFRISLSSRMTDERNRDGPNWMYRSFELAAGHRAAGHEYVLPNPISGEVRHELRYIPLDHMTWIFISCGLGTPHGATDRGSSRYAQSYFGVNINAQNLSESELRKTAHDDWSVPILEYTERIRIDGATIVRFEQ